MKEAVPAATEASQGYSDKALLNLTVAQLKAALTFSRQARCPPYSLELDF
jgi:hypothetical protein